MTGGPAQARGQVRRRRRGLLPHLWRWRQRRRHHAPGRVPPRHGSQATVTAVSRPAVSARSTSVTSDRRAVPGKAKRRRRHDQRRLLRSVAKGHRSDRGRPDDLGARAARVAREGRAAQGIRARRVLAADGHLAGQTALEELWRAAGAVEGHGSDKRILARPPRIRHRPYGLQGQLAVPLAAASGRRGHRLRVGADDEPQSVRGGVGGAGHALGDWRHPR